MAAGDGSERPVEEQQLGKDEVNRGLEEWRWRKIAVVVVRGEWITLI